MVKVPIWVFSNTQNIDGKLYTEDFVKFIINKLKTNRLVFDSFEPGPKSFEKNVICEVYDIYEINNKYIALVEYNKNFKFLENKKLAIYFAGKTASHINGNEQIFDKGDIIDPIFFSMVQLT